MELLRSLVDLTIFDYLRQVWGDAAWVEVVLDLIGVVVVSTFCLLIVVFLIWLERKVIARMQDRIGPNRVGGKYGLLQTVADVLKLLSKESFTPANADKPAYNVAPFLIVISALMMWAVLPFAPGVVGVDLNIGLFYVLAISSVSVVSLLLAGWGSNNKYALLGAFRSVAQLVSYEVPMILSLVVPILLARSMSTQDIVGAQLVAPFMFVVPLSAVIFFISSLAETGRTPFDLLEAESEIVAGFHTEYSGMKFGMFFLAEFMNTLFMSGLFAVVFWGGWSLPIVNMILSIFGANPIDLSAIAFGRLLGLIVFFAKMFVVYFVYIWIRGTLPRVRVDQLLNFNWKFLVPLTLVLVFVVAVVDKLIPAEMGMLGRAAIHLMTNLLVGFGTIEILRQNARRKRMLVEGMGTAVSHHDGHDHGDHGHDDHAHDDHALHSADVATAH